MADQHTGNKKVALAKRTLQWARLLYKNACDELRLGVKL
jgi:hypothetical protein